MAPKHAKSWPAIGRPGFPVYPKNPAGQWPAELKKKIFGIFFGFVCKIAQFSFLCAQTFPSKS